MAASENFSCEITGACLPSPPVSMRSSKSVFSEVRNTLMEMVKCPNDLQQDANSEDAHKKRNKESFQNRLKTFTISNWMGKPLCLSPPLLSQYGWQCIGADTIKCCSCSSVVNVQLPMPWVGNYRERCYSFRKRIMDGHVKICSWPSYPCSDSLVAPFLNGAQDIVKLKNQFAECKSNLLRLGTRLPILQKQLLAKLNIEQSDLHFLTSQQEACNSDSGSDSDDGLSAFDICSMLSICGWNTRDEEKSVAPSIFCEFCGRYVRLRNVFTSNENTADAVNNVVSEPLGPEDASEVTAECTPKKAKIDVSPRPVPHSPLEVTKKYFHPLEQHCSWCHWIAVLKPISKEEYEISKDEENCYQHIVNPLVRNADPGWKVMLQTLVGFKTVPLKMKDGCEDAQNEQNLPMTPEKISSSTPTSDTKLSPKFAIADFRRLMAEITSKK